jgi:hypothetical protein
LWRPGISGSAGSGSSGGELDPVDPEAARDDLRARPLEDAELRARYASNVPVPVEVVGLEVERTATSHASVWTSSSWKLESSQTIHEPSRRNEGGIGEGTTHVAGHLDLPAGRAEDRAEQLGRRRLPVRAGDADQARARRQQPVAELDLAPDGDVARSAPATSGDSAGTPGLLTTSSTPSSNASSSVPSRSSTPRSPSLPASASGERSAATT